MSLQEWGLLEPSQKELYWDAMLEKYGTVVSLGEDPSPCPGPWAHLASQRFPRAAPPPPALHSCEPLT